MLLVLLKGSWILVICVSSCLSSVVPSGARLELSPSQYLPQGERPGVKGRATATDSITGGGRPCGREIPACPGRHHSCAQSSSCVTATQRSCQAPQGNETPGLGSGARPFNGRLRIHFSWCRGHRKPCGPLRGSVMKHYFHQHFLEEISTGWVRAESPQN